MSMKSNLDAVLETVSTLAQAGAAQTKKMATIARLMGDNLSQKDTINKTYTAIGKQYFELMQGCPDESFAELFEKVEAALATIAANNATIAELKAEKEVEIEVEILVDEEPACECEEAPAEEPCCCEAPAEEPADAPAEEPCCCEAPAEEPAEAPAEEPCCCEAPTEE